MENQYIPIKTALCSFGMSGWVFHAPFLDLHPGFELYAVLERSKNRAVEKYPGIKTLRSIETLLEDSAIELIIVNTPNATHFPFAKAALLAGKHVIVEKPFTVTMEEADELIDIASEKNLVLSVYQNRRFDSDYRTVKKVLDAGLLGTMVEAEIHFDRYKEELSPKLHKETPGPGTGLLYDLGSHMIDQALQLFGMPDSVFADISIMRPISQVDDYAELILFYPRLRVRIKSSYQVREALPSYIMHGSKGSFIKARTDIQEKCLVEGLSPSSPDWGKEPENEKGLLHTEIGGKIVREFLVSERGNYMDFYQGIYESIRMGKPVVVTPQQGRDIIRVIEAAYQSNHQGCRIQMDLQGQGEIF
jgi:scyllo-inositol 2-dehydrogenase (NADP+)